MTDFYNYYGGYREYIYDYNSHYDTVLEHAINRWLKKTKGIKVNDSRIYDPIRRQLKDRYKEILRPDYESIMNEIVLTKPQDWIMVHNKMEDYFNNIIDSSFLEGSFKVINAIESIVTKNPKIEKRKTIDNRSKYWNILRIYLPVNSLDGYEKTLSKVRK